MTTPAASSITPQEFIAKWRRSWGQESAGAQEWFIDLCRVVEHPTPAELDPRQDLCGWWSRAAGQLHRLAGILLACAILSA